MAAHEALGRQFLDRHMAEHHGYGSDMNNPGFFSSNESINSWHGMEHEVMEDTDNEFWHPDQVPHHHSEERIHFH